MAGRHRLRRDDDQGELTLPGLELGALPGAERTTTMVDLSLSLWEAGGRIGGTATYATSLFERSVVEGALRGGFEAILFVGCFLALRRPLALTR